MKANIELDIQRLNIQEFIRIEPKSPPAVPPPTASLPPGAASASGAAPLFTSLHIRNLDSVTLEKLCDDYTSAMFKAARLERPPQVVGVAEKEPLTLSMQWIDGYLIVKGGTVAHVHGGDSRYVGNIMLPNPQTYKSVFTTESKARKEMERVVMAWFERMTGESYV